MKGSKKDGGREDCSPGRKAEGLGADWDPAGGAGTWGSGGRRGVEEAGLWMPPWKEKSSTEQNNLEFQHHKHVREHLQYTTDRQVSKV